MASGIISAGFVFFSTFSPSAIMFLGIEKFTGSHLGADSSPDPLYLNNLESGHLPNLSVRVHSFLPLNLQYYLLNL